MKLTEKDIKFLQRRNKFRSPGILNHPFFRVCELISYSVGLFQFYITLDDKIGFYNYITVTLYWLAGVLLGACLLWERKRFLKIIDILAHKNPDVDSKFFR